MNDYTLYQGDCLDILPTIEAGSVDAIIADPPYGTTACKWDSVIPFEPMWAGITRVLKPRGACVLFGSQPFTSALVMSNVKWFKYGLVWEKERPSNIALANIQCMRWHEDVLIFGAGRTTYNPQYEQRLLENKRNNSPRTGPPSQVYGSLKVIAGDGMRDNRHPSSIIKCNVQRGLHPTQKPLALLEYLVKTYTNEGETVLDFTMGSGTTGHACGNLGRRFIGIEKDAGYFAIAEERIATAYEPLRHMQAAGGGM